MGASARRGSPGYNVVARLKARYRGRIYPVNPKYREVLG
ncbi:MAG: CoA-binding protein, partial [Thermoproteota archaeon]